MIVFIILTIILVIGIPIGISYLINWWIKKKGFDKRLRLISLIPILIVGYFIYDSIYPSSDFYKVDFKEVTNMEFPVSGQIKYKSASFPDHFGDYSSSFLAEFENNDLDRIENQLKEYGFEKRENKVGCNELDYIERKKDRMEYSRQYVKEPENDRYYFVGFLNDHKSVIVTRISW
ncbi:hypothetical protein SAMN05444411_1292 [Lutibacter oricola]|uniref:Uncharacterized protein n=1 Tax=Lutibacter oricola TaxID=762486 RepID=A0A1H3HA16_9FLAO|nr:hypothetical protein [Lutibacter oricola]SDY11738.1 hypothetical protein SAMN05444411_1292 [Lutibacter oricola]